MHEYYFKIKKADLEFEFSTTDKATFEEQMNGWIEKISKIKTEEAKPEEKSIIANNNATNDEEISILLDEHSSIVEEPKKEIQEEIPFIKESNFENNERNDFIDVKKMTSIKEIQTPIFEEPESIVETFEQNFEKTLEESIQNPKTNVIEKKDKPDNFNDYLSAFNPQSPIDNLIVTASYILNQENQERFSIKQLNAKLIPIGKRPVDHSVIKEAIDQNLVRIIPDLTGMNEVTEYTLTEEGEGYFVE